MIKFNNVAPSAPKSMKPKQGKYALCTTSALSTTEKYTAITANVIICIRKLTIVADTT